jgi:hypothetical protein
VQEERKRTCRDNRSDALSDVGKPEEARDDMSACEKMSRRSSDGNRQKDSGEMEDMAGY